MTTRLFTRLFKYGFTFSLIFVIASCGTGNNFHKSKSGRVKKVRIGASNNQDEIAKESTLKNHFELEEKSEQEIIEVETTAEYEEVSEEEGIPSGDLEIDSEETPTLALEETQQEEPTFKEIFKESKAELTRAFNDNHYATLGLYLGGLLLGAIGFIYWNAIPYIIGFTLLCGAFALSIIMKYKISKEQRSPEDRKYKNRMWLTGFVFYSCMLIILLTLIAFLVILV